MNQCSWTYVDDTGKPHRIGLAHGATSGHLLVHVNSRIALIDFHVFDTASYSIFINDELFNIAIEKKGEQFVYGFEIDKKADTARNLERRKQEKKHWLQTLALVGALILAVSLFVFATKRDSQPDISKRLAVLTSNTSGEVLGKVLKDNTRLKFVFVTKGRTYTQTLDRRRLEQEAIFPVKPGDEFAVRYDPKNPHVSILDYKKPSPRQLKTYRTTTLERHQYLNPATAVSQLRCQLQIAEDLKGLEGLALFYYQNTPAAENDTYNSLTYKKFVRDLPFQNQVDNKCWGQD